MVQMARRNASAILDPIVEEAQERFDRCETRESNFQQLFWEDLKVAMADSDNGYQWPNDIRQNRQINKEPSLTINKIRQHCLQIENDAKQNKPEIRFRPTGGGASYQSAKALQALVRHIQYISNAPTAIDQASQFQVRGGLGYIFIDHGYPDEDTFDQEIFIEPCNDPMKVLLDNDIKQLDGSDANFGFIFDDIQSDEFERQYPEYANTEAGQNALGSASFWMDSEYIRVCKYYRKTLKRDKLLSFVKPDSPTGERRQVKLSDIPKDIADIILADPSTMTRRIKSEAVEWFFIVGDKVVDRGIFPSKYIPICRVVGEEIKVNGVLERKGHVRNLKDAQRMYNFWTSSATSQVALQTKTPWVAPVQAIEGHEVIWRTANTQNHSVLPFNHVDEDGAPIPPPQRAEPPAMAQAYVQGMSIAVNEMAMVSGQSPTAMGEPGNERSAKAINERQRTGENSTYHFTDNMGVMMRYAGKVILDMIPKIYDTQRIIKGLERDNTDYELQINPQAQQAYQEHLDQDNQIVARILNPAIGKYEVEADIGPNYGTQRQEAFNAISLILAENPALTSIIGDILFRSADFPGADEVAERLKRMVPPAALGQGPSQSEQQLQQQLQMATQALSKALEDLSGEKLKVKSKDMLRDVNIYDAETKRLDVVLSHIMEEQGQTRQMLTQIMTKLGTEMGMTDLGQVSDKAEEKLGIGTPPVEGAKQATDGNWYLDHPTHPGMSLMVMPKGQSGGAPPSGMSDGMSP